MHNLQRSVSKNPCQDPENSVWLVPWFSTNSSCILSSFHPPDHQAELPDRAITKGGLGLTGATPRRPSSF